MRIVTYFLLGISTLVLTAASHAQVNWIRYGSSGNNKAFSPDGKLLAAITGERVVTVWDLELRRPRTVLALPEDSLSRTFHLSFSTTGDSLILYRGYGGFRSLDLDIASSKIVRDNFFNFSPQAEVHRTLTDFTGRHFAFISDLIAQDVVILGNAESGILDTLFLNTKRGLEVHLYANGVRALVLGEDSTVRVYDIGTNQEIVKTAELRSIYRTFIFEPANSFAILREDHSLRVFDLTTGSLRYELTRKIEPSYYSHVVSAARSPLAAFYSNRDSLVTFFDVATGAVVKELMMDDKVASVIFSPNDDRLAISLNDGPVLIYDASTWATLDTINGSGNTVTAMIFSKKTGDLFASGSPIHIIDPVTGSLKRVLHPYSTSPTLSLSPSEKYLATGNYLWDVAEDKQAYYLKGNSNQDIDDPTNVHFLSDSTFFYTIFGEGHYPWECVGAIRCGNIVNEDSAYVPLYFGLTEGARILSAKPIPGSAHIATTQDICNYMKPYRKWLAITPPVCGGDTVFKYVSKEFYGTSMAFNATGTRMLTASNDSLFLWDLTEGDLLQTYTGHAGACKPIGFSHNGIYFFSFGLGDSTIRVWEAGSGTNVKTYRPYFISASVAAVAPDGKHIIVGYRDGTLLSLSIADALSTPKEDAAESGLHISCVPNPVTHNSVISFHGDMHEPAKIELYNALGTKVADVFDGFVADESQSMLLSEAVKLRTLSGGVFFLTITTPHLRKSLVLHLVQ